ncbi:hypothetical protein SGFS_074310 [Streptomyces graminofaciens]|uniref:Uncharacterized protein n=1 Tax=Streptomyces graminofaciens TaxID=68212 RepID=A0ABM7FGE5_9ACTN|nr:hypothetical protein SGFS_074310 [Streptomyces graminofaciens]
MRLEEERFQEYRTAARIMIPIRAGSDQRGALSGGCTGVAGGGAAEVTVASGLSAVWGCGSVADVTIAPSDEGMGAHCGVPGSGL